MEEASEPAGDQPPRELELAAAEPPSSDSAPSAPPPAEALPTLAAETAVAGMASSPGQALEAALRRLRKYLPPQNEPNPLPSPSVSALSATERALGVGNRRGMEQFGTFSILALKGLRLDLLVRYKLWAHQPDDLDAQVQALYERLLAAKASSHLWKDGILRLDWKASGLAEHDAELDAWYRTADYQVLYEHRYVDSDGAESLIARIPIDIDDQYGEATLVTDRLVRWDRHTARPLETRGAVHRTIPIGVVSVLAYLPEGWDGGEVTVSASVDGVVHEERFASVRIFVNAFELEMERVEEGDERPKRVMLGGNPYVAGRLRSPFPGLPDPIVLRGGEDVFMIGYGDDRLRNGAGDDVDAVVYLRILR
jgi:hypothetical protein